MLFVRRLARLKVCLCSIVLSVTVCTVGCVHSFRRDQIFLDFVSLLSMILYSLNISREKTFTDFTDL